MISAPPTDPDLRALRSLAQQIDHGVSAQQRARLVDLGLIVADARPYELTDRARKTLANNGGSTK